MSETQNAWSPLQRIWKHKGMSAWGACSSHTPLWAVFIPSVIKLYSSLIPQTSHYLHFTPSTTRKELLEISEIKMCLEELLMLRGTSHTASELQLSFSWLNEARSTKNKHDSPETVCARSSEKRGEDRGEDLRSDLCWWSWRYLSLRVFSTTSNWTKWILKFKVNNFFLTKMNKIGD